MERHEAEAHERRRDDRYAIDLPASVRAYRWGPHAVRIVDVSAGGAMVALPGDVTVRGAEVALVAAGIELVATVAWTTEAYCGLAFHRRLSDAELAAWRRRARTRPKP